MWQKVCAQGQFCHWWQYFSGRKLNAMELVIALLVVLAPLIYLAWRSPRSSEPGPRLFGSVAFEDRDIERVRQELVR
jgi:hypothetical protein